MAFFETSYLLPSPQRAGSCSLAGNVPDSAQTSVYGSHQRPVRLTHWANSSSFPPESRAILSAAMRNRWTGGRGSSQAPTGGHWRGWTGCTMAPRTVRWVPWSEDFNLSASYRPLWSAIGAKAPKISMHSSKLVQRQEFLTFADLLGDLSLNISLGLLWDNIVASYQRAP